MAFHLLCGALLSFALAHASGLRIWAPTEQDRYETSQPTIELAGVLSLPQPIRKLEWETSRGARGSIQPASYWRSGPIPLTPGENWVAVTATDENGQATQSAILVFRSGFSTAPLALVSGDILEQPGAPKDRVRAAEVVREPTARWPNATVPYVLDASLPAATRQRFQQAVTDWQAKTPIRFVPRTSETSYVRVYEPSGEAQGCHASVGRWPGESIIALPDSCQVPDITHEIGHTAGLYHEHARQDRDRYLEVLYANVEKANLTDFDTPILQGADDGPYDYSSLMHYSIFAHSRNGKPVMRTLPPGLSVMGEGLSPGDIDGVRRLYGSPPTAITVTTNPAGLRMVVDGQTLVSPQTFGWAAGTSHTLAVPSPQGAGDVRHVFGRWGNDAPQTQTIVVSPGTTTYVAHMIRQCKVVFAPGTDPFAGAITVSPLSPDDYYACDSEITLSATPAQGYAFVEWDWADLASKNPVTFRVVLARGTVYPQFTKRPMVTVTSSPPGRLVTVDGLFTSTPANFLWTPGSRHTLAVSDQTDGIIRYSFTGWSQGGAASQTLPAPEGSATYTASFKTRYRLTAKTAVSGAGTVSAVPASADGYYDAGATVQLTAQPAASFRLWTGDLTGTANPQSLVMDDERLTVAYFSPPGSPTISAVLPATVVAGAAPFLLNITGNGFYDGLTQVRWNGVVRPFRALTTREMQIQLNAADLAQPGPVTIGVSNPGNADVPSGSAVFTVTASPAGCYFALSAASLSLSSYGGSATVTVTTGAGCAYSATAGVPWIEALPPPRSPGSATLNLWVAPNGSSQARTGAVRVAGQVVTISQAGAPCKATLTPASLTLSAAASTGSLAVWLPVSDCRWTAESSAGWLRLTSAASGTGSAILAYTAEPNGDPSPRNAEIRVAGQSLPVQQGGTQPAVTAVSAASFLRDGPVAPGSLAAAFGPGLARQTEVATSLPLPAILAGTRLVFQKPDKSFIAAQLLFVSPTQINFVVPSLPDGPALAVATYNEQSVLSGAVEIARVAPGLFSANANGQGAAAAVSLKVSADGKQTSQITFQCGATPGSCVSAPIDLGADTDQVILLLFGTGIRGVRSLSEVSVKIGGLDAQVLYAGPQAEFDGLDQVNLRLPRSLAGRGELEVLLSVEGKPANTVTINLR